MIHLIKIHIRQPEIGGDCIIAIIGKRVLLYRVQILTAKLGTAVFLETVDSMTTIFRENADCTCNYLKVSTKSMLDEIPFGPGSMQYMHVCVRACASIYTHTRIYIYIYILYMYTYIHKYMYTYIIDVGIYCITPASSHTL